MNDKQQLLIDCISLLPVIGILVLITVANDQLVTMVAAYVLCGELLPNLIIVFITRSDRYGRNGHNQKKIHMACRTTIRRYQSFLRLWMFQCFCCF